MNESIYDRPCKECGHPIDEHDANECWHETETGQCPCWWWEA